MATGIYVAGGLRRLVWESREALTQLYCIRASRDSQTTSPEASGDLKLLNDDRQSLSRLSNDFTRGLWRSKWRSREASGNSQTTSREKLPPTVILDPSYVPKPSYYTRPSRHCSETKIGSANRLAEKLSRVKVTSNTFFYSAPKLWNRLASQAKATSIESFKNYFNI